jgi:hypothetical protein
LKEETDSGANELQRLAVQIGVGSDPALLGGISPGEEQAAGDDR